MRLRSRPAAILATAAAVVAVTAVSASASPAHHGDQHRGHSGNQRHGAPLDHIFVIMLENHSQSSVIDDPNAQYITGLAHQYSMADNYYGVTHPSMPNYLAAIAGDNFGIQDDNSQNIVGLDRTNLVDQLEARHVSWDAYMENLPTPDKLADSADSGLYAKKHDPFVLFDDVKNNTARMDHVRDYTQLGADLNSRNAPQFVWITPNQCHDMHGGVYADTLPPSTGAPCPYGESNVMPGDPTPNDDALKQKADVFVHTAVDTITNSRAWTRKSAIVILTDENDFTGNPTTDGWENADGCCDSPYVEAKDPRLAPDADTSSTWPGGTYGGGLIPAVVVTASGPRHFVDHTPYNHYSLLTTIEDNWRLGHIGHAGDAANGVVPMWPSFTGHGGH